MAQQVSFRVTDKENAQIVRIVDRALGIIEQFEKMTARQRGERRINLIMDLTACHANGNPLDLDKLVAADDFNVMHDVGGISRHIDHDTGQLNDFFSPRRSKREAVSA